MALTEPGKAERAAFAEWMRANTDVLQARYDAAEALGRAYDRAAVVTKDGGVAVPEPMRTEIRDLYQAWEATRWTDTP